MSEENAQKSEKALVPVEEKEVEFYGDEVTAVRAADGIVYIPVRPICRLLGLNWDGQRRRILRDPVLAEEVKGVVVSTTPGGRQEMLCLPAAFIPFMLSTLSWRRNQLDGELISQLHNDFYFTVTKHFDDRALTKQERIRRLTIALLATEDEKETKSLITELALVSGLGVIPRVDVNNQQKQIYLAQAEDGLCKIGVSSAAKSRIQSLNRNRADDVCLLHEFPADEPMDAERKLHRRYRNKRAWGEWFQLTQAEIQTICGYVGYRAGQFIGGST